MMRKIAHTERGIMDIHIDGRLYLVPQSLTDELAEYGDNVVAFPRKVTKASLEGIPFSLLPECFNLMAMRGELYERPK